jgi:hypothetical protein
MTLREHMEAIYKQYGRLTPDLVVETARPKDHPLHTVVFNKSVKDAAEQYYRDWAQELIKSIRITYTTPEGGVRDMRAFHAVRPTTADEFVYEPAEKVAEDPLLTAILLRDMEREWRQMFERFGRFQEFVEIVRASLDVEEAKAA